MIGIKMRYRPPSNHNFGYLFTGVFALLSIYAAFDGKDASKIYGCLLVSVAVGLITVSCPNLLTPFNKAWLRIGDLMGKIVSPLVLGVIFFLLISPIAIISRLLGRDELRLIKKANVSSYWIDRAPHDLISNSFKNQF